MKIFYMILLLIMEIFTGIQYIKVKNILMKPIFYLASIECAIALFIIGALG